MENQRDRNHNKHQQRGWETLIGELLGSPWLLTFLVGNGSVIATSQWPDPTKNGRESLKTPQHRFSSVPRYLKSSETVYSS